MEQVQAEMRIEREERIKEKKCSTWTAVNYGKPNVLAAMCDILTKDKSAWLKN